MNSQGVHLCAPLFILGVLPDVPGLGVHVALAWGALLPT
jgi:hypothetical protein